MSEYSVDPSPGGAFAVAFGVVGGHASLLAVDDNTNPLSVFTIAEVPKPSPSTGQSDSYIAAIDAALAALLQAYS